MSPPDREPLRSESPDDTSRTEDHRVSIAVAPDTGKLVRKAARIFAVLLVLCFVLVEGIRLFEARALAKATDAAFGAPPPVDVVTVRATTAGQELMLPGETAAWFETTIYARVNGYVAQWSADIGDHVEKGRVLASIETPELDAELAAARAELRAAEAQVSARQAEAAFSKSTNERWRDSPKGVVSDQERESKKADYESAEARLYAAYAQVALDKAKVEQYSALSQFKQVIAPFAGTVTERQIDVGNLVTAGSASTTTPLYRVTQSDPLRVFVNVPQGAAEDLVRPGIPAQIYASGATQGVFAGKIARASQSLSPQARTMRVEVDMPNAAHALLPGMYVNVGFQLPPKGRVQVPAAALIYRPGATQVARVGSDGKVQFSDVTISRDDGSVVELGSGAAAGDRLVLNISSQIAAGQRVTINASDH
jgi:RND family efflux transporter MFP subunit